MNSDAVPVQPGDTLAGKYRVERVLGSGGMGVVVAATHLELGQRVALKFLLPAALHNAEAVARFLREARAAVQISSEHVARVSDVGRLESGAPFMVMEYLEGADLASCPKGNALPIAQAVDYVLQAAEAVATAHAAGIVHRDLKPANLFLTTRSDGLPLIKVLDFGISKLLEAQLGNPELTKTAAVMGSPLYMSPEQMRSARDVDVRTDVWALGSILHELLTGTPPFNGETLGEVFARVMTFPAPPLRQSRPEAPERLEAVVLRALEKDPGQRFPNVGAFAVALGEFAAGESVALVERIQATLGRAGVARSTPPREAISRPASAVSATDTSWQTTPRASRRSTPLRAGLAVGIGLLCLTGLWSLHRARTSPVTAPSSGTSPVSAASGPPVAPVVAPLSSPASGLAVQEPAILPMLPTSSAPASSAPVSGAPRGPAPSAPVSSAPHAPASSSPSALDERAPSHPPAAHAAAAPANADSRLPPSAPSAAEVKRKNPLNIDFK